MVPAFNSKKTIQALLQSILNQSYPVFEKWVIDDASVDNTAILAQNMGFFVHKNVHNKGRGYTRALGIEKASGNYVFFCDTGVYIDSYFLEKAMVHFQKEKVGAVFGRLEDHSPSINFVDTWRKRYLLGQEWKAPYNEKASLQTAAVIFNKEAVLSVGNFNKQLKETEDRDLGNRLIKNGWKVIYDPALKLNALTRNTLMEVLNRYHRWNSPIDRPFTIQEYLKNISYSIRVMCRQDFLKKDYLCVLISFTCPHYMFFRSLYFSIKRAFKNKSSPN